MQQPDLFDGELAPVEQTLAWTTVGNPGGHCVEIAPAPGGLYLRTPRQPQLVLLLSDEEWAVVLTRGAEGYAERVFNRHAGVVEAMGRQIGGDVRRNRRARRRRECRTALPATDRVEE